MSCRKPRCKFPLVYGYCGIKPNWMPILKNAHPKQKSKTPSIPVAMASIPMNTEPVIVWEGKFTRYDTEPHMANKKPQQAANCFGLPTRGFGSIGHVNTVASLPKGERHVPAKIRRKKSSHTP
mmetsp:Transcript_21947/g.51627  ORF Transcript_21947/g.51627 Transcript_21947/m.51627 type:complete len:123 (+) Transcript_21947:45-413(+)